MPNFEPVDDAPAKDRKERERDLRRRVAGQMRQPGCRLPREVWERLAADGRLDDYLDLGGGETLFEQVLDDARTYNAAFRGEQRRARVQRRRRGGVRLPSNDQIRNYVELSECLAPEELKRAELLTRELVRFAENYILTRPRFGLEAGKPVVAQFRDKYLGGRVLTVEEARLFSASLGVAVFELAFFQHNNIPVVGHVSALASPRDWEAEDSHLGLTPRTEVSFNWADSSFSGPIGDRARHLRLDHNYVGIPKAIRNMPFVIGRNSILYHLEALSIRLSALCPWKIPEAAWFVLTGKSHDVIPIDISMPQQVRGTSHACVEVSLRIQPWLSRTALLKVYRQIQRILIGPRNRPPTMKSLIFYEFVVEQRQRGLTFSSALSAWRSQKPSERKKYPRKDATSVSRFASQFRDIERQVLRPFGHPDFKEKKV